MDWFKKIDEKTYAVYDHAFGFSREYKNCYLDQISNPSTVYMEYMIPSEVRNVYPHIDFKFYGHGKPLDSFTTLGYVNVNKDIENFVCCFNNCENIGRQFLTSLLHKKKWFNPEFCTKNFVFDYATLDGNLVNESRNERLDRKFIVDDSVEARTFYQTKYAIGDWDFKDRLEDTLVLCKPAYEKSFVCIVSETLSGCTYVPYATEKLIYPIITNTLWLAYASPKYHQFVVDKYGFKLYTNIFNYSFDSIINPVERLISMTNMLGSFQAMSKDDWMDLYQMEKDTIKFNKDHYFSKDYLKKLDIEPIPTNHKGQ